MVIRFKLVLVALATGFVIIGGRMISLDVPPYSAIFLRFCIASVLLFLLLLKKNELKQITNLSPRQWFVFAAAALTGIVGYNLFMLLGVKTVPAIRVSIIYGTFPILTWVAAWLVLKERFSRLAVTGSLLCLAGVVLALAQGSTDLLSALSFNLGDIFIFLSLLSWVVYSLITVWLLRRVKAMPVAVITCILATLLLLPAAINENLTQVMATLNLQAWLVLLVQGVFSTFLAFIWYCQGVEKLGAGKTTLFLNLMPLATIFMAGLLLQEPIYLGQIIGAVMVFGGVVLAGQQRA